MSVRSGILALALVIGLHTLVHAQEPRRRLEAGGVALLVSDQGYLRGIEYGQRATLTGARGSLRVGPVFARGSYLAGSLPAAGDTVPGRQLTMWEAAGGVFVGAAVRLEAALWYRGYQSALGHQKWAGYRVGIGAQGDLIPGLVSARATAHYLPAASSTNEGDELKWGWSGEVEMAIRPRTVPVRLSVGYRVERFDCSVKTSTAALETRQMRLAGVLVGLQFSL